MNRKTVAIGDFVTPEMFELIKEIGADVDRLEREVIRPNLEEINRKLGQENNSRYLAYAVVHAINQCMGS